jgi:hypothetical protein
MTPTLALALEDFVPVIFTLLALFWVTRLIFDLDRRSGYVALVGSVLVVSGGLLKASSKLYEVFMGELIIWMENSLFLLMAPGFALVAWSVWTGQVRLLKDRDAKFFYPFPVGFPILIVGGTLAFGVSESERTWFLVLLSLVVLMSSIMLVLLSRHAWHYKRKGTAALFLLYLGLNLLLNGLARTPSPTITVEWIKQLLNTAATGILLLAAWRLWRVTQQSLEEEMPPREAT